MGPQNPLSARLRTRAKARLTRVVLPEGDDPRVLRAAGVIARDRIAVPMLLGPAAAIAAAAAEADTSLDGLIWYDPSTDPRRALLANRYRDSRSGAVPPCEALELMSDPLFFGTMLVESGAADGLVAGARATTGATIAPALQIRRLSPGLGPITSCFLMELPAESGLRGIGNVLVFADCALNPDPSPAMVAQIAIAAARACEQLCELTPAIALLSSSSHGSASHAAPGRARQALMELQRRAPTLTADGELQADAALIPAVAAQKAATSQVAGRANVLVFPDLESGNIAYKLVERLARARAIGPLFAGLNFPINDLSRGCDVDDIVNVVAVTAIQAAAAPEMAATSPSR